jgi:hypothetical protein
MLGRVMKNVDLPEAEQDFPCQKLQIRRRHRANCILEVGLQVLARFARR